MLLTTFLEVILYRDKEEKAIQMLFILGVSAIINHIINSIMSVVVPFIIYESTNRLYHLTLWLIYLIILILALLAHEHLYDELENLFTKIIHSILLNFKSIEEFIDLINKIETGERKFQSDLSKNWNKKKILVFLGKGLIGTSLIVFLILVTDKYISFIYGEGYLDKIGLLGGFTIIVISISLYSLLGKRPVEFHKNDKTNLDYLIGDIFEKYFSIEQPTKYNLLTRIFAIVIRLTIVIPNFKVKKPAIFSGVFIWNYDLYEFLNKLSPNGEIKERLSKMFDKGIKLKTLNVDMDRSPLDNLKAMYGLDLNDDENKSSEKEAIIKFTVTINNGKSMAHVFIKPWKIEFQRISKIRLLRPREKINIKYETEIHDGVAVMVIGTEDAVRYISLFMNLKAQRI